MQTDLASPAPLLLIDFGATFSHCALYYGGQTFHEERIYRSQEFASPLAIIDLYLKEVKITPSEARFALATPLTTPILTFTNITWEVSQKALLNRLPIPTKLYNDFEALAFGLDSDHLTQQSLHLTPPKDHKERVKIVLGPGTGLGTALLLGKEHERSVLPSEGGFSYLSANDPLESALFEWAKREEGKESFIAEEWLGGKEGIPRLIRAIKGVAKSHLFFKEEADAIKKSDIFDSKSLIEALKSGDPVAELIFARYLTLLANFCGDLILTTGAEMLYLGGGILPRVSNQLRKSSFISTLQDRPAVASFLATRPILLIDDPYATLRGMAYSSPKY